MASYGQRTVPKLLHILVRTLLGFSRNSCMGMARIFKPHLDYWVHAVQAAKSECKEKFIFCFLYQFSLLEGCLAWQRSLLCIQLVGVAYSEVSMKA